MGADDAKETLETKEAEALMDISMLERQIRETDCEALEQYRLGVADAPVLYRPAGFLKAVGSETEDMVFVASDEAPDRMGDEIMVGGWQLDRYKANPVMMFSHDYRIAPVAIAPRVWPEGKQLLNTVRWDMDDEFAAFLQGKYQRGFMRAESVGFKPLEFEARDDDKGMFGKSYKFSKQELLEISLVAVPAHPAALRKAMGEGRFTIVMPEIPNVKLVTQNEPLSLADIQRLQAALKQVRG